MSSHPHVTRSVPPKSAGRRYMPGGTSIRPSPGTYPRRMAIHEDQRFRSCAQLQRVPAGKPLSAHPSGMPSGARASDLKGGRILPKVSGAEADGARSMRAAAAAIGVTPMVIRRWIDRGDLSEPPWPLEELRRLHAQARPSPGAQAGHGTLPESPTGVSAGEGASEGAATVPARAPPAAARCAERRGSVQAGDRRS
jgi:hypothetical protein